MIRWTWPLASWAVRSGGGGDISGADDGFEGKVCAGSFKEAVDDGDRAIRGGMKRRRRDIMT